MTLESLLADAERRRKSLVVYAATETDLEERLAARDLRVEHRRLPPNDPDEALQQYWFLAFDGGGDDAQTLALAARDPEPDRFDGVWTYDPELVDRVFVDLE